MGRVPRVQQRYRVGPDGDQSLGHSAPECPARNGAEPPVYTSVRDHRPLGGNLWGARVSAWVQAEEDLPERRAS